MANHCLWLDRGVLMGSGKPDEVIDAYLESQHIKKTKANAIAEDV